MFELFVQRLWRLRVRLFGYHLAGDHAREKLDALRKPWGMFYYPYDQIAMLRFLDRFAGRDAVTLVELGVGTGVTATRVVEYLTAIRVAAVEYFGIDDVTLLGSEPKLPHPGMAFLRGNRDRLADLPDGVDFFFIDGCHCCECVVRDAVAASRKVRVGGFMGFHDTSLSSQYPAYRPPRSRWQHYGQGDDGVRPLAVVEGIAAGRPAWHGDWSLIIQANDELIYGGIRVYERTA